MNSLFIKLAFRNILKNRISTLINVIGFSIGMAVCLFIFLFVKYETSFDKSYPNSEKIYRVVGSFKSSNDNSKTGFMWFPMAKDIKSEIPGVNDFCRISSESQEKFIVENQSWKINNLRFADANFFQFFDFGLEVGNPQTVLNSADKIVLTAQKAKQIFGQANPIGKTIMYNHKLFTVSGIAASLPANTHLGFDALLSTIYMEESELYWKGYGGGVSLLSYLELSENVTPEQIEKSFPDFLNVKINKRWKKAGMSLSASLQKIADVHLSDGTIDHDVSTNRSRKSIFIIVSISLLLLLLAVINYIILFAAQKITKDKNTSILKVYGAGSYGLMGKTYFEVFCISTIASVVGVLLLLMGRPFLNEYLQTSIMMKGNIFSIVIFLIATVLLLSFFVTIFSGRRSIFTKSTEPITKIFAANVNKKLKGSLLVSFQFSVVIVLLVAVFIVSRQNSFLLNANLGFDKENILTLSADEEFSNNELVQFKHELAQLAEIHSVSLSSQMLGSGLTQNGYTIGGESDVSMLNVLYTDADFLDCFNVQLLAGRNYKKNPSFDKNSILINESLVKRSGWDNPIDKKISRDGSLEVIGVVEDFNFSSLENAVQPMLIMSNPNADGWGYSVVNIRFQTTGIESLLAEINYLWKVRFPETPVEITFLDEAIAMNYKSFIVQQKMISFFSSIGILIAVIGLFGLTIFSTRTRVKEIGIRKVNGASIKEIMVLLNRDFVKWVVIAFVIATPIAYYVMSLWLENFAYKIKISWWVFAMSGTIALAIAMLTVSWQSWKAATDNPIEALRTE